MARMRVNIIAVLVAAIVLPQCTFAQGIGLRAPPGFEVTQYAGDDLAHDIYSMTIDAQGRIVVAGAGYIKVLHDDNKDGVADRATLFSDKPASGAHGMCFIGSDLMCTGDNGLLRLRDTNQDGVADGEPEVWATLRHAEHGANGIARGPDGWIYVICGNDAGVMPQHATTAGSPIRRPMCGALLRFSPDGKQSEIVAHGFRNPYDFAFAATGNIFTVDADGERDQHLPWYSPTRLFDIAQGMHHGWVLQGWQRSWNRPPWYFDSVERLVEIGRGSPTGVAVYRHRRFPEEYQSGVFSCCWTLGRVYHFPLRKNGSTFESRSEVFLETTGDIGFAPVDLAIGPRGDMFVAIGGRRTRGSVFRVHYRGVSPIPSTLDDPVERLLAVDDPLSAWSRAEWMPAAKSVEASSFLHAAADEILQVTRRIRAIEIVTEMFEGVPIESALRILRTRDAAVRARVAWSLSRKPQGDPGTQLLAKLTHDDSLVVQRAAWEAIAALSPGSELVKEARWSALEFSSDRRVRAASLLADFRHFADEAGGDAGSSPTEIVAHLWRRQLRGLLTTKDADAAMAAFDYADTIEQRLDAIRLAELALGDIVVDRAANSPSTAAQALPGYALSANAATLKRLADKWGPVISVVFPSRSRELNLELARFAGAIGVEHVDFLSSLSQQWSDSSPVPDDLHYLMVLSRIPGRREALITERTANALARLHGKMATQQRFASRNWPLRLTEVFEQLVKNDPELPAALLASSEFGLPEHSLFVAALPLEQRPAATRRLIELVRNGGFESWPVELIDAIANLPDDEAFPLLRDRWDDVAWRDAVVGVLSRVPQPTDRPRFVQALASPQPSVVEQAAVALLSFPETGNEAELFAAMTSLKRFLSAPTYISTRVALAKLIAKWSGQSIKVETSAQKDLRGTYQGYFDWFAKVHPASSSNLNGFTDDVVVWRNRLQNLKWEAGDAAPGKLVFERRACSRCHAGNGPLGPDLAGAASRMSRDDLFVHIIDPNKEVSPLYQTTQVMTNSGRIVVGLIVYESPEGTLVQTGPDTTVRVSGEEIVLMQKSNLSLMPSGLLTDATDQEIVDLYAHLKTIRGRN